MMESEKTSNLVIVRDLEKFLSQTCEDRESSLVLIGPGLSPFEPFHDLWPGAFEDGQGIPFVPKVIDILCEKLISLTFLTRLILWGHKIGDDDARHLAKLTNLKVLDLRNNVLGDTGVGHLAKLTNLTSLNLGNNRLQDSSAQHLVKLTKLRRLVLRKNRIRDAGAQALSRLTGLKSLDLSHNELRDPGAWAISKLKNLTALNLDFNEIGDSGAQALSRLKNLTTLNIQVNRIGDVGARALGKLSNLRELNASSNEVSEKGAQGMTNLVKLTTLQLGNNKLGDGGAHTLSQLTGLCTLDLSHNAIGSGGALALEKLTNLSTLDLSNNPIDDLGIQALGALANLRSLDLTNCKLGDSGVQNLVKLTKLTKLDLGYTNVKDASPLTQLPMLETLRLHNTKITDISSLRSLFERGIPPKWFDLSPPGVLVKDCPLTHPPPEVVQQGLDGVLNYFREIDEQGVDKLFEAKMLLVGEGRAGKTSLIRRLYQPDRPLPHEEETTKGIDIFRHNFPLSNGRNFRLNVWDFGGQQIYYATHQFFLTKNSLYILLDDTAKDYKFATDEGFSYWLEIIELLSAGSPVLIFQNEKGGRSKSIDERGIKSRFPNVKEIYRGNLLESQSVTQLSVAIDHYVENLPHIGEEVPAKWVSIRAEIEKEAQEKPYISQEAYFKIYGRHLEFNRLKALHLSRYLHDLGVFLHYQDDPLLTRTVILQNQWATEGVFRLLESETVKTRNGQFTHEDCQRIWSGVDYVDMHLELRALMEKFELCYALADVENTWLAPQLLSPSRPQLPIATPNPEDLILWYRYDFLPKGLINRLMVRMHRFVQRPELAWATGVLFEREETQVLVETKERGNEIVLCAKGPEKKALLSVIASDLDALNSKFPGLEEKLQKLIPCVCPQCQTSTTPELFEQKRLLQRKRDRKLTVECPSSYQDVKVLQLLDGLKLDQFPPWSEEPLKEKISLSPVVSSLSILPQKTITIFLASSEELRQDRDAFDLYFRQQNDGLVEKGIYLKVKRWENALDAMSKTRLQEEYNLAIRTCDIFVSLFATKTGKYTEEEFNVAHERFNDYGTPYIYTFFKVASISTADLPMEDLQSLYAFQKKLKKLGHFYTQYHSIEDLKLQFKDQLEKLLQEGKL